MTASDGTAGATAWSLSPPRRAMLFFASFAALWAIVEGVFGARLQHPYALVQIVWCRYLVHLVCVFMLWGWRRPAQLWRTRRLGFQLARSMLMLVMPLTFGLSIAAADGPATVWAIFWITPVLILVFSRIGLHEQAPLWIWALALATSVVAAVMMAPSVPLSISGVLLPLAMAVSFSVYVVMTRSLRAEPLESNLFYTALGVFLVLTPVMPFIWSTPSPHDALLLAAIGAVGLVALWTLDRACSAAPVGATAPTLNIHLVVFAAIGFLVNSAAFSHRELAGTLWICGVVGFMWLRRTESVEERHELASR